MTTKQGELNLQRSQAMMEEASSFSPRGVPNCKWWAPDTFYVKSAKGSRRPARLVMVRGPYGPGCREGVTGRSRNPNWR